MTPYPKLSREFIRIKIKTVFKEGYTVKQISEKTKSSLLTTNKWKKRKKLKIKNNLEGPGNTGL